MSKEKSGSQSQTGSKGSQKPKTQDKPSKKSYIGDKVEGNVTTTSTGPRSPAKNKKSS